MSVVVTAWNSGLIIGPAVGGNGSFLFEAPPKFTSTRLHNPRLSKKHFKESLFQFLQNKYIV